MAEEITRRIPVSEARLRSCCKEKGISVGQLGKMTGHSDGYFRNKLTRNTFTQLDIGFLESIGIRYEDIKPLSNRKAEENQSSYFTKEDLEDVLSDFLVEMHKMQEELIKEMKELWT